jgi:hypothetical protein
LESEIVTEPPQLTAPPPRPAALPTNVEFEIVRLLPSMLMAPPLAAADELPLKRKEEDSTKRVPKSIVTADDVSTGTVFDMTVLRMTREELKKERNTEPTVASKWQSEKTVFTGFSVDETIGPMQFLNVTPTIENSFSVCGR